MGVFLTALALTAALGPGSVVEPLPSRTLPLCVPLCVLAIPETEGLNFDLYEVRAEKGTPTAPAEEDPHTIFAIKRHFGIAAGYDNGVFHGSVGMYVTVAELGHWNFGVTSPGLGFGRYRVFDRQAKRAEMKTQSTILISLASVHYRGGHIRSIGKDWYFTLEQIFDARANQTGSQFGFSFANP